MAIRYRLLIGDTVYWRGGFGTWPERPAKVTKIVFIRNGKRYGMPLPSIDWARVAKYAVVELENGYWAYGDHIRRIEGEAPP